MTTRTHSLTDLMQMEYVKNRYDFEKVEVTEVAGVFFATAVLDTGAEFVVYTASANKEAAALVNLSGLYGGDDRVDLSEHIFEYYAELPKYKGVNEEELWKFSDDLAEKFAKGIAVDNQQIAHYAAMHLHPLLQSLKLEGDVYVEFSSAFHKQAMTVLGLSSRHIKYAGEGADSNFCAICDSHAAPGEDFCETCKGEVEL